MGEEEKEKKTAKNSPSLRPWLWRRGGSWQKRSRELDIISIYICGESVQESFKAVVQPKVRKKHYSA